MSSTPGRTSANLWLRKFLVYEYGLPELSVRDSPFTARHTQRLRSITRLLRYAMLLYLNILPGGSVSLFAMVNK